MILRETPIYSQIKTLFSSALFENSCVSCNVPTDKIGLCPDCESSVEESPKNVCATCGEFLDFEYEIETGDTYLCGTCRTEKRPYSEMKSPLIYSGPARDMVHSFKFRGQRRLSESLARLADNSFVGWLSSFPGAVIIPVPLSWRKLLSRGFNPTYLLARRFSEMTNFPVHHKGLRRVKHTPPQFGLNRDERKQNVKNAFALGDKSFVTGKTVILFDDIMTTGATVNECCKALKKGKPKKIIVATLFRTK